MTYQEAIDMIEPISTASKDVSDTGMFKCRPITEALDMALEALEKQIPKKPIKDELENGYVFGYYCPACGADDFYMRYDSNTADHYECCAKCGQAIDWSDANG